eukprot:CAMPEP_0167742188 /NCGR_PEP_ID=MMETSP0110_2-20121227/1284_1 /TAXON_ID=629695 /ORGANISM="Gymnochlora sp., Strain CCMP2014" /LENGTH=532 /DNA_ID=CAMNT_0007626345 /DNA_START=886 /DNA_END=2484 /DNA_ORIENTATION=-
MSFGETLHRPALRTSERDRRCSQRANLQMSSILGIVLISVCALFIPNSSKRRLGYSPEPVVEGASRWSSERRTLPEHMLQRRGHKGFRPIFDSFTSAVGGGISGRPAYESTRDATRTGKAFAKAGGASGDAVSNKSTSRTTRGRPAGRHILGLGRLFGGMNENSEAKKQPRIIRIKRNRADPLPEEILLDDITRFRSDKKRSKSMHLADTLIDRIEKINMNLSSTTGHLKRFKRLATLTSSELREGGDGVNEALKRGRDKNAKKLIYVDRKRDRNVALNIEKKRSKLSLTKSKDENADYEVVRVRTAFDKGDDIYDLYEEQVPRERLPSVPSLEDYELYGEPPVVAVEAEEYMMTSGEYESDDEADKDDSNAEGYYKNEYPDTPESSHIEDGVFTEDDLDRYMREPEDMTLERDNLYDGGYDSQEEPYTKYTYGSTNEEEFDHFDEPRRFDGEKYENEISSNSFSLSDENESRRNQRRKSNSNHYNGIDSDFHDPLSVSERRARNRYVMDDSTSLGENPWPDEFDPLSSPWS